MLKLPAMRSMLYVMCLALLVGCAQSASPTSAPVPDQAPPTSLPATEPAPTELPAATIAPFNLSTPAIVIEHSQGGPTATPDPPPIKLPDAPIVIYRPGPGSQVTSPFQVYGRGGPSYSGRVHVRLLGEDGRVIQDQTTFLLAYPGNAGNFVLTLDFDTPWVAENARLEVSTEDPRFRRMDELVTVDLVLLSAGSPRIHSALNGPDKLAFLQPRDGSIVEGGLISVLGGGWADSDLPLDVQLLDRSGTSLWAGQVSLDAPQPGMLGTFQLEIPYQISWPQYAQLTVQETATGIPGIRHYSSIELWLRP